MNDTWINRFSYACNVIKRKLMISVDDVARHTNLMCIDFSPLVASTTIAPLWKANYSPACCYIWQSMKEVYFKWLYKIFVSNCDSTQLLFRQIWMANVSKNIDQKSIATKLRLLFQNLCNMLMGRWSTKNG